jgi:hypothetical protein
METSESEREREREREEEVERRVYDYEGPQAMPARPSGRSRLKRR